MKKYLVSAKEMQQMDKETIKKFGIPGIVLMENAGRNAVDFFMMQFSQIHHKRIGVLAGHGNNGGDGFVMARYLLSAGEDVIVYLMANHEKLSGDALFNYELLTRMGATIVEIPDDTTLKSQMSLMEQRNIWIDALFGTGLNSEIHGRYQNVILWLNSMPCPVFSVDIPSGLNADTGKICGICVAANATITFGHVKIGQVIQAGVKYCGKLAVSDIGIPASITKSISPKHYLLTPSDLSLNFCKRPSDAHKGTSGHILVLGGSKGKTGACAMTAQAAMRVGCGLLTLGVSASLNSILETQLMEVMTLPLLPEHTDILEMDAFDGIMEALKNKKCMAIGPGMGTQANTIELVLKLLVSSEIPMVIDADALNCLSGHTEYLLNARTTHILTPHPGEMARLMGLSTQKIQSDRLTYARHFAASYKVILVLKGEKTIIAFPDGTVAVNPTGNPGMASAGMGDVLTGVIAGIIAQGVPLYRAVTTGVYIHGLAGDILSEKIGNIGFLATDLIQTLPIALEYCLNDHIADQDCIPSWFCHYV